MNWDCLRLARLTVPAKLLVTLFVLIVGPGYLVATANIYFQHREADGEDVENLGLDDLRRTFHGIEKTIPPEATIKVNSKMLEQVREDGDMYKYLEKGGEPAIRSLTTWLEEGQANEEDFAKPGAVEAGDPSPKEVIALHCVECHNSDGGENDEFPYAAADDAEPEYQLVMVTAKPEITKHESEAKTIVLKPTSVKKLIHVTHAHILSIPVFTLLVGVLFMMTGFGTAVKMVLGPLPMLAVMCDIGSWWLARLSEPFIYVIAASGAVFGAAYGLQILCILCSTWCGRREDPATEGR